MSDETLQIVARSYTRGRRYPRVIGTISTGTGRFRLPGGPYSIPQFVTAAAGMVLMVQTRAVWGSGGLGDAIGVIIPPLVAGWLMRRARIEGREPHRAALGLAKLVLSPATGRYHGRGIRPSATRLIRHQIRTAGLSGGTSPCRELAPPLDPARAATTEPDSHHADLAQESEPVAAAPGPLAGEPPQSALARLLNEQYAQIPS